MCTFNLQIFQRIDATFPDFLHVNGANLIGHNTNTSENTWQWTIVSPTSLRKSFQYTQVHQWPGEGKPILIKQFLDCQYFVCFAKFDTILVIAGSEYDHLQNNQEEKAAAPSIIPERKKRPLCCHHPYLHSHRLCQLSLYQNCHQPY